MRPDAIQAERNAEVRQAARAWRRGGAIESDTLQAIEAAYPDDRNRARPVFRILLFLFTLVAAVAAFGLVWFLLGERGGSFGLLALVFGILMAFLTELQTGNLKRVQGGTEAATSFAAVVYLLMATVWLLDSADLGSGGAKVAITQAVSALVMAAAAWRWGYAIYAAGATVSLLLLFAQVPGGRLIWIAFPLVAAPFLLRLSAREPAAPSHRTCCTAVLAVALTGLYVAVHYGSYQNHFVEDLSSAFWEHSAAPAVEPLRWISAIATAVVPLALLAFGVRLRRRVLLDVGLATLLVSVATLFEEIFFETPSLVIALSGAGLLVAALALRRWLDAGTDGERHGFTAQPLYEDLARHWEALEIAAALALTPAARTEPEEPKLEGGGGDTEILY